MRSNGARSSEEETQGLLRRPKEDHPALGSSERFTSASNGDRYWGLLIAFALPTLSICALFDVIILCALFLAQPLRSSSYQEWRDLPLRSSYLNFDQLYKNSSFPRAKFPPTLNHAAAFYQVSSKEGEKDKVMEVWSDIRLTSYGMTPLLGRHLIVNSTMSTFTQLPILDYGMEKCSIALSIPQKNETNAVIKLGSVIDVYTYPSLTRPINFKHMSWETKPKEADRVFLYSLSAAYGETHKTPKFECRSLSSLTVELSCVDCNINIVATEKKTDGLYMWQYQTL